MSSARLDSFEFAANGSGGDAGGLVGRALLAAQHAADATLAEARADAERIRSAARAEVAELETVIAGLRDQVDALAQQMATAVPAPTHPAPLPVPAPPATPALPPAIETEPAERPKVQAPEVAAPASDDPQPRPSTRALWSQIPFEALLPIIAIVVVLLVMLALMG